MKKYRRWQDSLTRYYVDVGGLMAKITAVEWNHIKETWLGFQCTACNTCFPFIEGALAHDDKPCTSE